MEQDEIQNIINLQQDFSSKFKDDSLVQGISFAKYNTPIFKESKHKKFISIGPDNNWPNYLVQLMNDCPLHGTIIQDKQMQICGEGFTVEDSEDKGQLANLNEFLKKINIKKSLKRWALDQQLFGYWFIGITWNKDRTKIANIYHVDASTIRVGEPNEDGEVENFWYSELWKDYRKANFRPERIQRFDPLHRIDENCLLMIRGYRPATRFYNIPSYNGGRDAIELNIELTSYMLNSIKEGFAPTLNVSFNNGIPTSEERNTVYNTINNLFKGSKGQRFILSFNNSKENATEITPINVSNMSEIYAKLGSYAEEEILKSHKAPKVLYGIPQTGKLGGGSSSNELELTSEEFTNKVIEPARHEIEEAINDLLLLNDYTLEVFIKPSKKLSSQFSDTIMLSVLTVDEIRAKQNMPPLADIDKKNLAINISTQPVETNPLGGTKNATVEGMSEETPEEAEMNKVMRGMTGRESQNLLRIIRQVASGKIGRGAAEVMLQSGYGLTPEQITKFIGEEEEEAMNVQTPGIAPYVDEVPTEKKKIITKK